MNGIAAQGGATVISSFLRGYGGQARAGSAEQTVGGQLVDRVVITIAPVFLQGYNVLDSKTDDGCDASSGGGAGETGCYCCVAWHVVHAVLCIYRYGKCKQGKLVGSGGMMGDHS